MPKYGQMTELCKPMPVKYCAAVSVCLWILVKTVAYIVATTIFAISANPSTLRIRKVASTLGRNPWSGVLAAGHIRRTREMCEFTLAAHNGCATQDSGQNTPNPVREWRYIVHGVLPEDRHLLMRAQDAVEQLAHDNEKGHQSRGDHGIRTRSCQYCWSISPGTRTHLKAAIH